jgi:raffinose/stachyose/melibiose transport system substrate-binding protein
MKKVLALALCLVIIMTFGLSVVALKSVPVKSITLDKSDVTLNVGKTNVLTVTLAPANTTQKLLLYSTNNKNIAAVDANGKITAVGIGKAVITVTSSANTKVLAKCNVTVPQIVITMEHQDTEKPERAKFYDQLAVKYNKLHPDVKIEITKSTFNDAQKAILTAISSGHPFDIIGQGPGATKIWLEKNAIMDVTKYLEANNGEWKNTFRDGIYDALKYVDGKVYCIPYYLDAAPLNYNKDIFFNKEHVSPAKTKEEFYALCDKFKADGYIPFQLHGSMKDDFLMMLTMQFSARDKISQYDIMEGKVSFLDPWFKDSLTLFKDIYDRGYLPKNFWTIGGTDGRMAYATGKMPQKFGFFWDVDTHKDMGMPYENQAVASLPNFTGVKGLKVYKIMGVSAFMVSSQVKNPDTALDFLKFLTNTENQDDMAYKYFGRYPNGMPVVNKNVELSPYALQYMNDLATGIGSVVGFMNVSLKTQEVLDATIPQLMEGKMTVDQVAQEFEKIRTTK